MGFLAPWFLAGLAAVGLPVWLHLLKRHKTTPLPFSSLMFFERRTQSSIKHRRLRYLLLFAARTALVALLALVFADPFLRRESAPAAHGRKLLVLAVDNSFSMRHGDRLDTDVADNERIVVGEYPDRGKFAERTGRGAQGTAGQPDRNVMLARERADTTDVIVVLMRDQNSGEHIRRHIQTRQPFCSLAQRKTAVDQQQGVASGDKSGVAAAAATQ